LLTGAIMGLGLGKILKKGIVFGVSPERWLPIFIVDFAFFSILTLFIMSNQSLLLSIIGIIINPGIAGSFPHFTGLIALGVMWLLLKVWVVGAVIHQSHKEKEFNKSWHVSSKRYSSLIGSLGISFLIILAAASVPFFDSVLVIIAGVVVFFPLQSVIIRRRSAFASIRDSYSIFKKQFDKFSFNGYRFFLLVIASLLSGALGIYLSMISTTTSFWAIIFWIQSILFFYFISYSRIFRLWFVIAVISGAVALVFFIPGLFVVLTPVLNDPLLSSQGLVGGMTLFYFLNPNLLLLMGTIFLVGSAISTAFTLKIQTDVYKKFRKRFGIF